MKGIVIELKDITDSREMMESKESPKIRWFIYILLAAIVSGIIIACIFKVDVYSRVSGEIKTQDAASSVISANSCKLKKILVSEGQNVKAGDVLFMLDAEYAESQKNLLEDKLNGYKSDLSNTELLKRSIEKNENLFKNNADDSKFYYRFEQYRNGTLLTAHEIENSMLSSSLSKEDNQNNLASVLSSIADRKSQLADYEALLSAIRNKRGFSGNSGAANASYDEYNASYEKAYLLAEQYRITLESLVDVYNNQSGGEQITAMQVDSAKREADSIYSSLSSLKSSYVSDIRSQILLLENQLLTDRENADLQQSLADYKELKNAVEQDRSFTSQDSGIQGGYDQYITQYKAMCDEYTNKMNEYQMLYEKFSLQSGTAEITDADIAKAQSAYDSAVIDMEALKTAYISQIQTKITALNEEIKTLEKNQKSLEVALKNVNDLDKYQKLSADKLKNEAVITVNAEIDALNDNIISLKSQLAEIDETIKNSEIKASVDGTVTLINELSTGDIVQAGSSLCSIIPDSDVLKATLYIPESEIAKVAVGQKTEYIIDAVPYSEFGKLTGEITSISADAVTNNNTGAKFYIAYASISSNSLTNKEGDVREIRTGMLLEAKSISGSKRVITWMLEQLNFIE